MDFLNCAADREEVTVNRIRRENPLAVCVLERRPTYLCLTSKEVREILVIGLKMGCLRGLS